MKLRNWAYFFRQALSSIWRNRLASLAAISTVAVVILMLGLCLVVLANLDHTVSILESQVEIVAYLSSGAKPEDVIRLRTGIMLIPGVTRIEYVTKEQALERLKEQFGAKADLLVGIEEMNPLRDMFEIKTAEAADAPEVAGRVSRLKGIDEVDFQQDVVMKLVKFADVIRVASAGVSLLLLVGTLLVISNTVRLAVHARWREIGVMKLVGATDWFIRWPFLVEGSILGMVGAGISTGVLWYSYGRMVLEVDRSLPFLPVLPAQKFMSDLCGGLVLLGVAIGVLGSYFSVKRYLRV